jgi:hypothetical protein
MTLSRQSAAAQQMTWEPFDPEKLGYDLLSGWLAEFYSGPPWNEYMKCFQCSSPGDFTFTGAYSRDQLKDSTSCPECGAPLNPFWTPERARAFFAGLAAKGKIAGFSISIRGEPVGCIWGYEIGESTPALWEPKPEGRGVYIDRMVIVPEQRNGVALWYMLLITLRELRRDHSYLVTRTHLQAQALRANLQRLGFHELNECPILPQRSYWVRSLEIAGGLPQFPE